MTTSGCMTVMTPWTEQTAGLKLSTTGKHYVGASSMQLIHEAAVVAVQHGQRMIFTGRRSMKKIYICGA